MLVRRQERGISLIELMVGMVVGLIVIGGASVAFLAISRNATETAAASKVNTELTQLSHAIGNELRRAGYFETAALRATYNQASLFIQNPGNLASCIVYLYQEPNEATPKWYGFRYSAAERSIQSLVGQTAAITACTSGTWSNINDPTTLQIDSFTAPVCIGGTAAGVACADNGTVQLQIAARNPRADARYTASRTINTRVYLRN